MGIVTAIESQRGRVVVLVDGVAVFRLPKVDFDELPVAVGDELDEEEYVGRMCARQMKRAWDVALNLLGMRDMSRDGMLKALLRRGFLEPVAQATADRLVESNWINDERYAQRLVEIASRGATGRYALKRKLRMKGLDEETAEQALEELSDEQQLEAAVQTARSLVRRYRGLEEREARGKLSQALARRGFDWDAISAALDQVLEEE